VRKPVIAALTTLAASAALALPVLAGAPAADATSTCTSTIAVADVYVSSTSTVKVPGKWTDECTAIFASWNMQGGPGFGHYAGGWNFSTTSTSADSYYDPAIDPLGKYEAMPAGAQDDNGDDVAQGTIYFEIRLSSKVVVSGYRSGPNVFVRALVTRFSPSANSGQGGWVAWPDRQVMFASFSQGWQQAGSRWTTKTGYTRYLKISAPSKRSFRATVAGSGTVWSSTSKAFRE